MLASGPMFWQVEGGKQKSSETVFFVQQQSVKLDGIRGGESAALQHASIIFFLLRPSSALTSPLKKVLVFFFLERVTLNLDFCFKSCGKVFAAQLWQRTLFFKFVSKGAVGRKGFEDENVARIS